MCISKAELDKKVATIREYNCHVQVNRISAGKYSVSVRGCKNEKDLYTEDFSKAWKKKNISIYLVPLTGLELHSDEINNMTVDLMYVDKEGIGDFIRKYCGSSE